MIYYKTLLILVLSILSFACSGQALFNGSGSKDGNSDGLGHREKVYNHKYSRFDLNPNMPVLIDIATPNEYSQDFADRSVKILGQGSQFYKIQNRDGQVAYVNRWLGITSDFAARVEIYKMLKKENLLFEHSTDKTFLIKGVALYELPCYGIGIGVEWRELENPETIEKVSFEFQLLDINGEILTAPNGKNLFKIDLPKDLLILNDGIQGCYTEFTEPWCENTGCCIQLKKITVDYNNKKQEVIKKNFEKHLEY